MKIKRVLVVYRKSLYQIYFEEYSDSSVRRALHKNDAIALSIHKSDHALKKAQKKIKQVLDQFGIETVIRWRGHLRSIKGFDLVISLGGDGTLLDTSHRILDDTPLLGINSDPKRSIGALCGGSPNELSTILEKLLADKIKCERASRIRIRVDGYEVLGPALNDVLYAHSCPAGLTRFDLAILPTDDALAVHSATHPRFFDHCRSSGIWVATPKGSTAAIHSAGGIILAPSSRKIQYLVREPYPKPSNDKPLLQRGLIEGEQAVIFISRIRQSSLWADGPHHRVSIRYSQQIVIDRHPLDLFLVPHLVSGSAKPKRS